MNKSLAMGLSVVFHPLLMPSYLYYVVCYQLSDVVMYPLLPERWVVLGTVVLFTLVLPTLGTGALYALGLIDSVQLRKRQQRTWPFLLATVSFAAAAVVLWQPHRFDALLSYIIAGMAVAVALTFVVTLHWQISAHGVGVGGATAWLALLSLKSGTSSPALGWLVGFSLIAWAVVSARLALNAHTPAQVWAGLALGVGVALSLGLGLYIL
ncbi:hypothetical protein [Hymenobacter sp. BT491]|uniref:hypothetical protein n=1 Tax=Hymenobacter sp. BT491 TaxID=2766779 RepID=UPI001653DB60|nr:hypothetical protein [Hymenobacter sp. BT491]MBC6991608.1 hypothetical protein [Hymenobacter sp. BT491]